MPINKQNKTGYASQNNAGKRKTQPEAVQYIPSAVRLVSPYAGTCFGYNNSNCAMPDPDFCCPVGTHFNEALNKCVPDSPPIDHRCGCPENMHYNTSISGCVYDLDDEGNCPCGTKSDGEDGCVREPIPVCPRGFRYDESVDGCVKDVDCSGLDDCFPQPVYTEPDECLIEDPCPTECECPPVDIDEDVNALIYPLIKALKGNASASKNAAAQPTQAKALPAVKNPNPTNVCPQGYAYVPSLGVCVMESFLRDNLKKR